jgi:chromate transporter
MTESAHAERTTVATRERDGAAEPTPPREPYGRLFLRFLHFGALAWGGPVAQIAMLKRELVEQERWISPRRFNHVLGVYQALPGPEAHELCVYFGMLARGRLGGLLAGLGFMLPGFGLMFALSWFYLTYGTNSPLFGAFFRGAQAAVLALIVLAVYRIGSHAVRDGWLLGLALLGFGADLLGAHFALTLLTAGAAYALIARGLRLPAVALGGVFLAGVAAWALAGAGGGAAAPPQAEGEGTPGTASLPALLMSGLRAGLLTFGGAYTAIPFLQKDAVQVGQWMTNQQFLDGLALSGSLPAPLIIFSTFVGYVGGGPMGALVMTFGIFLPAFLFTLVAHDLLEWLIEHRTVRRFLDGVTAGVVGLITATTLRLLLAGMTDVRPAVIFGLALLALWVWKAKAAVAAVMAGAGLLGLLLFQG